MKKIIIVLIGSLLSFSAHAVLSLTLTHITDPNFRPEEKVFNNNNWVTWRIPCSSESPHAAHPLCYSKNYVDLLDMPQLQAEIQVAKNEFEARMAIAIAKISFYPIEIQKAQENLAAEISADQKFIEDLAMKITEDIHNADGN